MNFPKWILILVIALPTFALAGTNLTRSELSAVLKEFHPDQADFNSALGADQCLDRVASRMVELARGSLRDQGYAVEAVSAPRAKITYTEKFREYGAHVYGALTYGLTLRDSQGRGTFTSLSFDFDTTTQLRTSYQFVRKGQAIATDTRQVWVSPSMLPELGGHPFLDRSQDQFVNAEHCELTSPPVQRTVDTYPCGIDPSESCPDSD